jgi:DNA-binding PadR family transcriptional regulator
MMLTVTERARLSRAATYLTLHALEERGLVASVEEPRPASTYPRRRYRLTDSGRDALGVVGTGAERRAGLRGPR